MRPAVAGTVLALSTTVLVGSVVAWMSGVGGTSRSDLEGPPAAVRPAASVAPAATASVTKPSAAPVTKPSAAPATQPSAAPAAVAATTGPVPVSVPDAVPDPDADPVVVGPLPPGAALPEDPAREPGRPVDISIPSIGVQARVVPVGLARDGTMEIPPPASTGWFAPGARVGSARGSAVIAGHVDSRGRAGAFISLRSLALGAEIVVTDDEGQAHRFQVTERFQVAKTSLPIPELFRRDGSPTLTLITCGGEFRRKARSYTDNIVIRAVPASPGGAQAGAAQVGAAGVGASAVTPSS
jgi:hypothetical protein